jgi:predicted RNA-binding Zn-ribbon protein involved in translation (DUF1610 family)
MMCMYLINAIFDEKETKAGDLHCPDCGELGLTAKYVSNLRMVHIICPHCGFIGTHTAVDTKPNIADIITLPSKETTHRETSPSASAGQAGNLS